MTGIQSCSSGTHDALKEYISDWARIIYDATGDQTKVDRAILIADLNGMFDPVKVAGLTSVAQPPSNCDCGFSAEVCKTNPCMRKKMATSGLNPDAKYPYCGTESVDRMEKISALISRLQSTLDHFGDTCVYIRRGGLSWGAVALNRQDDDRKHGVFDLQAQHDRDMEQRAGQVGRLIVDRNRWMERAMAAEASSVPSTDREGSSRG